MDLGTSLTAIDATGRGLRVTFTKRGDRWSHEIARIDGDQVTTLLTSLEGSAADAWPASPPFQELSRETLPDGRDVLFLIGRAGTSHWSASVEATDDPPQLLFDIACRHGQTPERLGSDYKCIESNVDFETSPGTALASADGTLKFAPQRIANQLPGTTRWQYRFPSSRG